VRAVGLGGGGVVGGGGAGPPVRPDPAGSRTCGQFEAWPLATSAAVQ
jgi:hypothetical protein